MNKIIKIIQDNETKEININEIVNAETNKAFDLIKSENIEAAKQLKEGIKTLKLVPETISKKEDYDNIKNDIKVLTALEKDIKNQYEIPAKEIFKTHKEIVLLRDSKLNFLKALKNNKTTSINLFLKKLAEKKALKEEQERKLKEEKERLELLKQQEKNAIQEKEVQEKEKELVAKAEVVEKNNIKLNEFDTTDLKIRKKPKKLIVSIKEGKLIDVFSKLQKQGLDPMDYIKKIEFNAKKLQDAYKLNVLTNEELDIQEIEQDSTVSFK